MPLPIDLAHRLAEQLSAARKDGSIPYLRPDGKTQVTVEYDGDRPVRLDTVVLSTQHAADIDLDALLTPDIRKHVVEPVLERFDIDASDHRLLVNPTGRFEIGGPMGDAGLTGRKIIVDTYGGMARHGGGAFSGKDPSKVDRSAAYAMRWVAKNVVAAGLAGRCEVQVAYAIGKAHPVGLLRGVLRHRDGAGRPRSRTRCWPPSTCGRRRSSRDLDLKRPIYAQTAAYGHFGRRPARAELGEHRPGRRAGRRRQGLSGARLAAAAGDRGPARSERASTGPDQQPQGDGADQLRPPRSRPTAAPVGVERQLGHRQQPEAARHQHPERRQEQHQPRQLRSDELHQGGAEAGGHAAEEATERSAVELLAERLGAERGQQHQRPPRASATAGRSPSGTARR